MSEYCPTRNGKYFAYTPEYLDEQNVWKPIPIARGNIGIPFPLDCGGLTMELGLCGKEQAYALAHHFAAQAAAIGTTEAVRIQRYEVLYDLKARKLAESEGESR